MKSFTKLQAAFALSAGLALIPVAGMAEDEPQKVDLQAMISALSQEAGEFIIPLNGPVVPSTRPLVPSGSADLVRVFLKKHDKEMPNKPIVMEINTTGGDWITMKSILQAIKTSKTPVNTRCQGYAASAGAFVLMSGKFREASGECAIVLHNIQIKVPASEGEQIAAVDRVEQNTRENIYLQEGIEEGKRWMTLFTGLDSETAGYLLARDCGMHLDAAKALNVIDKINDAYDPDADKRKFVPTPTNICVGHTVPDNIFKKIESFVKSHPRP